MLARYKGGTSDVKEYRFKGKTFKFSKDNWTPVHNILLFIELSRYPDVFDTVCFFDLNKLKRYAKEIYIDKDLIFTSRKSVARQIEKLPFIRLQATKPERGEFIFQVLNYANSDLSNYERVSRGLNILIYRRLGGLGDIIMTFPVIEEAKKKYPNSNITYVCPTEFISLLDNNPFVDKVKPWSTSVSQKKYDVVIDLTKDCIEYEKKYQPNVKLNRTEVFLKTCGLLSDNSPRPKIYLSEKEIVKAMRFTTDLDDWYGHLIVLVLKSNASVREWPYFKELRNQLLRKYPTCIILEMSATEPEGWEKHNRVIPVFGFNLREVAALINECDLVVSPDTGLAHIAGALGIPTVWLFTHIDGKVRTKNYKDVWICQVTPDTCPKRQPCWYEIPCGNRGRYAESTKDPVCSTELTLKKVMETCEEVLSIPNVELFVVDKEIDTKIKASDSRWIFLYDENQVVSDITLHRFMIADGDIVASKWNDERHLVYDIEKNKMLSQIISGGLLIRRETFLKVGKFDSSFMMKSDPNEINYIEDHKIKEISTSGFLLTLPVQKSKVLFIVRDGGLGDILMTSLVLKNIRQKYFNYVIHYFCDHKWIDILKDNPYLDGVFNLRKLSKFPKYDKCIDLIESVENYCEENNINKQSRIDRFFELCGVGKPGDLDWWYRITKEEKAKAKVISSNKKIIGFGLTAVASYRNWPLPYYEELSRLLNPSEWEIVLFAERNIKWLGAKAIDLTGKTEVRELFAYVNECDLVVCGDTGISHICAAVDVPNVIFYGTIPPEARCSYYGNAFPMKVDVSCAPCWDMQIGDKDNWKNCRKLMGAKCVTEIIPEQVFDKIKQIEKERK